MKTEIFNDKFTEAVRNEIVKQSGEGKTVTRKTIGEALGYTDKDLIGVELIISQMFALGLLSEFKMLKKVGRYSKSSIKKRLEECVGIRTDSRSL